MRASPRSPLSVCSHALDIYETAGTLVVFMQIATVELFPPIAAERLRSLHTRTAEITLVGLGHVGLPLSLLFSKAGRTVIVSDHSKYNYAAIAQTARFVANSRNATNGVVADHVVRC